MKLPVPLILSLLASATAFSGVDDKKVMAPPAADDRWKFLLAAPGFMAGIDGDVGIDGVISKVGVGFFDDLLPRIDMIWATRAEASKGRFGILGELIYLSLSDGAGTAGVVQKVDVRVDQYLADFTLRWRLVEGERGFVDVLAGVRYTNLYQALRLQGNDRQIGEVAEDFSDEIGSRLRERIDETLSEGRFRSALRTAVGARISDKLGNLARPEPPNESLPGGPLAGPSFGRLGRAIERIVEARARGVIAAAREDLRQAAAAETAAAQAAVAAERARFQAQAAALRSRAEQRVATAKDEIEKDIEKTLKKNLNRRFARCDDWWDPYIGIRARYNFTPAIYVIGRGDIGGFGVGSDLMWQAEAALGFQVTRSIFAELGYRALSFDYEGDGLTYDTITHGAQLTMGVQF